MLSPEVPTADGALLPASNTQEQNCKSICSLPLSACQHRGDIVDRAASCLLLECSIMLALPENTAKPAYLNLEQVQISKLGLTIGSGSVVSGAKW